MIAPLLWLLVGVVILVIGVIVEWARSMATAPSMHRAWGLWVALLGLAIAVTAAGVALYRLYQFLRPWIG